MYAHIYSFTQWETFEQIEEHVVVSITIQFVVKYYNLIRRNSVGSFLFMNTTVIIINAAGVI